MGRFIQGPMEMADVLKGPLMLRAIKAETEAIASNVRDLDIKVGDRNGGKHEYDLPVTTGITVTDRARGLVSIAHPAGLAVQAKHGALTKAASEAGLEVNGR